MMSDSAPSSDPGSPQSPSRPRSRGARGRGKARGPRPPADAPPAEAPEETPDPDALQAESALAPAETASTDIAEPAEVGEESGGDDETFFAQAPEEAVAEPSAEAFEETVPVPPPSLVRRPEPRPAPYVPAPPAQPASPASVRAAIEEVEAVLSSLREASETLDELLELLEEAERQKTADEREIEALRATVRRFHGPRDDIPRPHQGGYRESREPREHREADRPRPDYPDTAGGPPRRDDRGAQDRGAQDRGPRRRRGGRGRGRGGRGGAPYGGSGPPPPGSGADSGGTPAPASNDPGNGS